MSKNGSIRVSTDFLKLLEGKCSLFFHYEDSQYIELLADIITSLEFCSQLPVICMHWGKSPAYTNLDLKTDILLLPISRNFTHTLICLGKLLADKQFIILIQNFDDMVSAVDRKPFFRFLAILLSKCSERNSTLLAASGIRPKDTEYETDINRLFENIFRMDGNRMQKIGRSGQAENSYNLFGEELTTQLIDTDMEKIREIFRLTPEEQKELDGVASKKIKDLNIT
jgi:hypothetical protein